MDRFTRFKLLRALWARAKNLLAAIHGPRARDERLRAQYWHQVNSAERHLRDGMIRGTGDPDSALRSQPPEHRGPEETRFLQRAQWEAQREAQRQHQASWDAQQRRHTHGRGADGRRP